MPRSQVKKARMFRDFSKLPTRFVKNNHLKNLKNSLEEFTSNGEITKSYLYFMLFVYDLEFFTISWVADEYVMNKKNLADRMIYPLVSMGYLYKHFDKLTPSQTLEDHLFRDETKFNYRVRYALSQKGRMTVQRFYNTL
mgnify:FL=1|jgi:hypothetical protein|tara:strand:- start:619 stop:1035 length:417 start_codon:yes stop_codon:yes gene_type:complete